MARKYFGTDGIRGKVGEAPITPDFVMRLGYAAGRVLAARDSGDVEHPGVLIGKDTRISGYMIESALQAGFSAAGVDVHRTGPMPTPAVAYLTRALRLRAGIVISASHNPYDDNGIKFFSGDGRKLPDDVELAIEAELEQPPAWMPSAQLGRARKIEDAAGRYIEFCKSTFPSDLHLRGYKIVLDCANGATYHIAPHVLHELGADVEAIGVQPDGKNINRDCGATHPRTLAMTVLGKGADFGIALDGDGDRLIMVDGAGQVLDGDQLLYIIVAHRMLTSGVAGVVGTQMTNLALEHILGEQGIPLHRAAVGDRYVMEALVEKGWLVGGENSGHLICLDKHTTGDGIVSALQVLGALRQSGGRLAELAAGLKLYPQKLVSVPVPRGFKWQESVFLREAHAAAERRLAGSGRILLRPSGTEPVLRVMVEGQSADLVASIAGGLAEDVRTAASA